MRRTASLAVLLACAALAIGGPAEAALNAYLTVDGSTQGPIEGDSTAPGREGTIEVFEYHHLVRVPAGGARPEHQTVVFTKEYDKSSVNLWQALETGESLQVKFDFYRLDQVGQEELYFRVTLNQAKVAAIEPIVPNNRDPNLSDFPQMERVRFDYGQITVEHVLEGESTTLVP